MLVIALHGFACPSGFRGRPRRRRLSINAARSASSTANDRAEITASVTNTYQGARIFHAQTNIMPSYKLETRLCSYSGCSKPITRRPSEFKGEHSFCCLLCSAKHQSEQRKDSVLCICSNPSCGKEFWRQSSQLSPTGKTYCSYQCSCRLWLLSDAQIVQLYTQDHLSTLRIAEMAGVTCQAINNRLRSLNVRIRDANEIYRPVEMTEERKDKILAGQKTYWQNNPAEIEKACDCPGCPNVIKKLRCEFKKYNNAYCSAQCFGKHFSILHTPTEESKAAQQKRAFERRVRRQNRQRMSEGSYTIQQWCALCTRYGNRCVCCGETKPLAADHIVPVSKNGTSYISNIQPLCRECNSSKGTLTIDYRYLED